MAWYRQNSQANRRETHVLKEMVVSQEPSPLAHLNEAELVALARAEPAAFGELYERYVRRIYNYIFYRTGNHHDAEDLTARVFARALQHIPTYKDRGVPFSAWLYRIAHNLVVNWHRDRGRRQVVPLDDQAANSLRTEAPERATELREEQELLLAAIRALPQDRQQLVVLKFVERLSNAEIGQIMGRSEGAIKSLYHRTLISLRDEYERQQRGSNRRQRHPGRRGARR